MKINQPVNALMLPGGGARGAYQVGVIKAILEILATDKNPFPVICGTSAGAINATVLASHAADIQHGIKRLEYFWTNVHCADIYKTGAGTIFKTIMRSIGAITLGGLGVKPPRSLLDNTPLKQLLSEQLRLPQIQQALEQGVLHALSINASSYDTAEAISFFQALKQESWRRTRRQGIAEPMTVEHVMASTALPFIFPAQRIGHQYYGDGGLRMTAPLSPAIHLNADRILVIGTRDEKPIEAPSQQSDYPSMGELGGYMLDTIFMDNMMADLSRLKRINRTLSLMPPEKQASTHLKHIETLIIKPSEDVRDVTARHANNIPRAVRTLLKLIGGWGKDWRMPSYLLFEPPYTKELIELGYQDAQAQKDTIRDFMSAPSTTGT
ncbi:patatin-like phospholipase family protein [Marinicella sp. W31]|uniref:patatin-like phospholipase family protein n=1 Tax=Marinicella sp. W31 TaxID=3023713 RepID=UPI0037571D86